MSDYPLTPIEERLKNRYLSRPDIQSRILTHEELPEYIAWLAQTEMTHWKGPLPAGAANFSDLARRVTQNPRDAKVIKTMSVVYENQREDRFLLAGNDIAIGRMIRYMPAHWHTNEYFEVYYCLSGRCPIHLESEVIDLKHGSVLILAPRVRHASPCYDDEAVLEYYQLRSSTFDKVFWNQLPADSLMSSFFHQALSHTKHASYLHFERAGDTELEDILGRLEAEYAQPQNYSSQYLNLLMSEFFLLMFRRYEGTAKLPRTGSLYWKHEFSAIFSVIQAHFADMTLSDIAQEFGYSERQINRIVKSCTGDTFSHLVLRLRMERAASLLEKGAEISAISEACGYSTLSSFYRAFQSYYNCPPAEYRNQRNSAAAEAPDSVPKHSVMNN